jgi:hypothetical protein
MEIKKNSKRFIYILRTGKRAGGYFIFILFLNVLVSPKFPNAEKGEVKGNIF